MRGAAISGVLFLGKAVGERIRNHGPPSILPGPQSDLWRGEGSSCCCGTAGKRVQAEEASFPEVKNGVNGAIARTSCAMLRSSSSRCGRKKASGLTYFYHAPVLLFHLLVVSSRCAAVSASTGRTQVVSVSAPWPTSCLSPLAEASEFVAEGDGGGGSTGGRGGLFWDYVEAVGNAPHWVFSCSRVSSAGHGAEETDEASESSSSSSSSSSAAAAESSSSAEVAAATAAGSSASSAPSAASSAAGGEHVKEEHSRAARGSRLQWGTAAAIDEAAVSGSIAAVNVAAVRAAGEGFGPGGSGGGDSGGATAPGLGLDELSLRLLEVALSAR